MTGVETVTHVRPRMGTLLAVSLPANLDTASGYVRAVFETASAWEQAMSRHRPDSTLSRVNARAGRAAVRSADLANVLRIARELSRVTDGAFDPTVAPVLDLWRRAARAGRRPAPRRARAALSRVDWRGIGIDRGRVSLRRHGMALDLGAIGKGFALDRITARLRSDGCRAALLNFGESSLAAIGPQQAEPWEVVLRHPLGGFAGGFRLRDRQACSTSGTFGQTLQLGSHFVSHVVDPRTGRPLRNRAQATVLGSSAAVAEAASTAMLVLGRERMHDIADRLGLDACWIDASGIHTTPGFPLRRLG